MIEEKILAALQGIAKGGVYHQVVPIEHVMWPAIVFRTIWSDANNTLCGEGGEDVRVQVDVIATSSIEVLRLRRQVIAAMKNAFPYVLRVSDIDGYEPDLQLVKRCIDFLIESEDGDDSEF